MNKQLSIVAIVLALIAIVLSIFIYVSLPKTGFIHSHKVFDNYKGMKELEGKFKAEFDAKKASLDSLTATIKVLQQDGSNPDALTKSVQLHQIKQAQLEQEYATKQSEYTDAIWKQINGHLTEYGKENGYDYIFGAIGNGSLMYSASSEDITDAVITYINGKYEGN